MTPFEISLGKAVVTYEGDPYPVWVATVDGVEAYGKCYGRTPGMALHQLENEFDRVLGTRLSGHWREGPSLEEVLSGAE